MMTTEINERELKSYTETIDYLEARASRQCEVIAAICDHIIEKSEEDPTIFQNRLIVEIYNTLKTHLIREADILRQRVSRREKVGH